MCVYIAQWYDTHLLSIQVQTLQWHPSNPSLLASGCYDGSVNIIPILQIHVVSDTILIYFTTPDTIFCTNFNFFLSM